MARTTISSRVAAGLAALGVVTTAASAVAQEPAPGGVPSGEIAWSSRNAEHLLNRAGFGAAAAQIEAVRELSRGRYVDSLFAPPARPVEPFFAQHVRGRAMKGMLEGLDEEARKEVFKQAREKDRQQLKDFLGWWVERMLSGEDALRERMTLFWHGYFPSSMIEVENSYEMIQQNALFRAHALGSFRDLLHAISRDAAMLEYLDNDANRRVAPNENFARELMELFTLGEGHYTETDVKEAARAFTGWTDRLGEFFFRAGQHDHGEKTVLGVTGNLDGGDVLDLLLEHPRTATQLAGRLLAYFEGREAGSERVESYAETLRETDYDVGALLRRLFDDPAFYRDEVVGSRVSSPVDYLIGAARRLGVRPPARLVLTGAEAMGEKLLYPPNVKGWPGGAAWITTSTIMQRGNFAGAMMGLVTPQDFMRFQRFEPEELEGREPVEKPPDPLVVKGAGRFRKDLKAFERLGWKPQFNLCARLEARGVRSDEEALDALLDELLAVEVSTDVRQELVQVIRKARREEHLPKGKILADPEKAEPLLREMAHLILSLPEAQLH